VFGPAFHPQHYRKEERERGKEEGRREEVRKEIMSKTAYNRITIVQRKNAQKMFMIQKEG
jgi:hypothetical protein